MGKMQTVPTTPATAPTTNLAARGTWWVDGEERQQREKRVRDGTQEGQANTPASGFRLEISLTLGAGFFISMAISSVPGTATTADIMVMWRQRGGKRASLSGMGGGGKDERRCYGSKNDVLRCPTTKRSRSVIV
jgi:hypothetical protein